jgi:hypothetical protein
MRYRSIIATFFITFALIFASSASALGPKNVALDRCPQDPNNDGIVGGADVGLVTAAWLTNDSDCGGLIPPNATCGYYTTVLALDPFGDPITPHHADADRDGLVGGSDIGVMSGFWLERCVPASIFLVKESEAEAAYGTCRGNWRVRDKTGRVFNSATGLVNCMTYHDAIHFNADPETGLGDVELFCDTNSLTHMVPADELYDGRFDQGAPDGIGWPGLFIDMEPIIENGWRFSPRSVYPHPIDSTTGWCFGSTAYGTNDLEPPQNFFETDFFVCDPDGVSNCVLWP